MPGQFLKKNRPRIGRQAYPYQQSERPNEKGLLPYTHTVTICQWVKLKPINQPERKAYVLRTEEKGCHQREIKKKFDEVFMHCMKMRCKNN